ncbi:nacht and wd domain protein [Penicillium samsonianum]|uniref:nacht and wd domain protein n=1 Tax=Penicillium samsonianum TaxID=1882272 RepID=UPI0025497CB2|nr:nacht and wd domain protein [Penicillium samsonianum]KAJ6140303.1 nacht and wd domain protein [Penicillium samsonianum]
MLNELDPNIYTVVWIAPLEIEAQAALHMLDHHHHGRFSLDRGDDYVFRAGDLGGHNIIIATLPAGQEYGTGSAAALASQVKKFFPNLWFGLLVGVAAGLPNLSRQPPRDIRLGDVLVGLPEGNSAGLIAYDLGKETGDNGFQLLHYGHVLANTETVVRSAIQNIKLMAPRDLDSFLPHYKNIQDKHHANGAFDDPGQDHDHLYETDDTGATHLIQREPRPDSARTRVWYGPIGSGEKLMKNSQKRNELRDKYGIIGLEMEAAGTMNRIPVGVVRGVCDYGDEHKNKEWQPYAAAMAAAYAKAVLINAPDDSAKVIAQSICRKLGGLPLALEQAGTFLSYGIIRINDFNQYFQERFSDKALKTPMQKYVGSYEKGRTLWAVFEMSYDGLSQRNPHAIKLLHLAAFFTTGSTRFVFGVESGFEDSFDSTLESPFFPPEIGETQSFGLLRWLKELRSEIEQFGIAIHELETSGFVKLSRSLHDTSIESCAMHALVRAFIRSKASEDDIRDSLATAVLLSGQYLQYGTESFQLTGLWKHAGELHNLLKMLISSVSRSFFQDPDGKYFALLGAVAPIYAHTCRLLGNLHEAKQLWDIALKYRLVSNTQWPSIELHMDEILEAAKIDVKLGDFESGITRYEMVLAHCDRIFPDNDAIAIQSAASIREARESSHKRQKDLGRAIVAQRLAKRRPNDLTSPNASSSLPRRTETGDIAFTNDQERTALDEASDQWHSNSGDLPTENDGFIYRASPEHRELLHLVSQRGDMVEIDGVSFLLAHGAINYQDIKGDTALVCAARHGHEMLARSLLQHGPNLDLQNKTGQTALNCAIIGNFEAMVILFLGFSPKLELQDHTGATALICAARNGNDGIVRALVASGADLNGQDNMGNTALIWAASRPCYDVVRTLLDSGPDLNAQDHIGDTALICAALNGYDGIVRALLASGPNLNLQNHDGDTALICAARNGCDGIVRALLDSGPDLNVQDHIGDTALIWAARRGNDDTVRALLDSGSDLNVQDNRGATALICAALTGYDGIVRALLASGPNLNVQNHDGNTALICAARNGYDDIVRALLASGPDLNLQDKHGRTALVWAIRNKHGRILSMLTAQKLVVTRRRQRDPANR